ncbi:serine/threonine protein kinase [Streptomyces agglomeratus]|uniref:serine/threonine-protein kinase n=1 Tax=Streptomyces agglomeratus TaxID=285458 RepID=UPI0008546234|nr:serine/threonine-protein kinase [Streptomyces agglomeratus]OEJ45522.1 serine/threonine protein kinase [Streptomyces agglomeratus]
MDKLGPSDPQRIGAYRLLARLGAGGMGHVYLARSGRGRTVAVKLVREELAEQEEFRARFRQEVAAARRVGGQWTAPVLDADTEATVPWVATGYVAGPDLHSVISGVSSGHGPLPERSVHILGAGLAHALRDIHAAGLIHRDLKPSNILITIDGPRVIDFGIARALETVTDAAALTRTGALVGSPGFMAPEQVRGERITPACDIFCLGSVLAYAATGRLPFGTADSGIHALMYRIATEPPRLDGTPEGLQDLIRSCLHKDPAARPALDDVLARTRSGDGGDPWLPAALVARLGRHAVELLEVENPEAEVSGPPETPGPADQGAGSGGAVALPAGRGTQPATTTHHAGDPATEQTPRRGTGPAAPGPAAPGPGPAAPAPAPYATPTLVSPSAPSAPYIPYVPPQPSQPSQPHTPPGGYGYPATQYAYQPPLAEPPPRSGRSTAALIAVALIVALGAGGAVYAFMNATGDHTKKTTTPPARQPAKQTPATGTASPATPPPSATPGGGAVPTGYLGTWSGSLDSDAGRSTRSLVIQQGDAGDTVLSLTADGPTQGGGTYHCVFQADLSAAPTGGGPLRIGPSRVTVGEPMSSCSPGAATEVTLLPDGRLRRVNPATGESLTYTKSG